MLVMPPTLTPTLFPTRRSSDLHAFAAGLWDRRPMFTALDGDRVVWADGTTEAVDTVLLATGYLPSVSYLRSEEHTSELQSRGHLVCRLLLEKKNDVS